MWYLYLGFGYQSHKLSDVTELTLLQLACVVAVDSSGVASPASPSSPSSSASLSWSDVSPSSGIDIVQKSVEPNTPL